MSPEFALANGYLDPEDYQPRSKSYEDYIKELEETNRQLQLAIASQQPHPQYAEQMLQNILSPNSPAVPEDFDLQLLQNQIGIRRPVQPFDPRQAAMNTVIPENLIPSYSEEDPWVEVAPTSQSPKSTQLTQKQMTQGPVTLAEPQDTQSSPDEVVAILAKIANHELANISIYNYFANAVPGILALELKGMWSDNAEESLKHYATACQFLIGRNSRHLIPVTPSAESVKDVPKMTSHNASCIEAALKRSMEQENTAAMMYRDLLTLVQDTDVAIANWSMTQIQDETEGAITFYNLIQ